MFTSEELKNYIETSSTLRSQSKIIAEWNMNIPSNISQIGNYRYRPGTTNSIYSSIPQTYDPSDSGNYYKGATDADIVIDGGYDNNDSPITLYPKKDKLKMLYSLEDCFKQFRPRSGINKLVNMPGAFSHHANLHMAKRPRYYMPDKDDVFKYWTSFRTESGEDLGIANKTQNGQNYISDAAPYIVYKDSVPTNRVVVKMQTHVGKVDLGPFANSSETFDDPFYGESKKVAPVQWSIQSLKNNNWVDIISFNQASRRSDGSAIIQEDGYLELSYGLKVPSKYKSIFVNAETYQSVDWLPDKSVNGYAYLIKESDSAIGTYYIWYNNTYETFTPEYGWQLHEEDTDRLTNFVTDLTSPVTYTNPSDGLTSYREFQFINGLRIVVKSMSKKNSTFDLIELSPRLAVDMSDKTSSFSITKSASDLGVSGLPVGQLIASSGSISIFDYDDAFNDNNANSIVSKYLTKNIQFKFYETFINVDGFDYFVPIKTMYSEGFPKIDSKRQVTIELRDLFFYFESQAAPQLLTTETSVSSAVSMLLDSIGFSNYVFKRVPGEAELVIPYFFVPPDKTVAQILQDIAISTQTAMFFDEYNNFVMMSKNYIMPTESQRATDITLYGTNDMEQFGEIENKTTSSKLSNIIDISGEDNKVYNDGAITYSNRYIQRSYGSLKQSMLVDRDKTWIYKPVLLWEVSGSENTKSINGEVSNQSSYVLSAIPLNSDLSSSVPSVVNHAVVNNIVDLGEAVYWMTRYNGYFYANGEVIKFDAVEYSVPGGERVVIEEGVNGKTSVTTTTTGSIGNVWIQSAEEYNKYFSALTFNGKMYPTGRVRIFSEPEYETVSGILRLKNGTVVKHGRGQFGTTVVAHSAGLNQYWSNNDPSTTPVRGCLMDSDYLFKKQDIYEFTKVSSSGQTITVADTSKVKIGQTVKITSGIGQLSIAGDTIVTSIPNATTFVVNLLPSIPLVEATIELKTKTNISSGAAGINNLVAQKCTRNGIIRNFLSSQYVTETELNNARSTNTATVQSSALVMNGPAFSTTDKAIDHISYVYKPLTEQYSHFGTRMRIVGKIENTASNGQSATGGSIYYVVPGTTPDKNIYISGGSGGLGVMIDPKTNSGYYFEIVALASKPTSKNANNVNNVLFYKIGKNPNATSDADKALPVMLYQGLANIIVDDGKFTGQYRFTGEATPTVYDLAVEYINIGTRRRFFLYINGTLVKTVDDTEPLPVYNNMAPFVRGSARVMFENIYALTNNYSQNTSYALDTPVNSIFGDDEIDVNESFKKYAMSGIIQSTYLSGINQAQPPSHKLYFEEFGTIMREASYFNIKYDKAYPALYAKISPTFNRIKGYTISGFRAGSYGADFLVFNATDTALSLDETTGNYLRIQGLTFTQQSQHRLTVDQYYSKHSDFSNPEFKNETLISSPLKYKKDYEDIKVSRMTYGKKDFSLDVPYVQTQDDANSLMSWVTSKILKPRKSVGLKIFANPMIQLGDIVNINYVKDGTDAIAPVSSRFVVYNIQYSKDQKGPDMTIYLSEVA